jgi:Alkylmercury lyase
MSADVERGDGSAEQLPPRVAVALAAAEIPPSRRGPARCARLSAPERALYFWILRRFASDGRPAGADTRIEAERLGLDAEEAFATLAREDLVHLGANGEIMVAYPFSGLATAHRVRFASGHETYAMCAIDALGIAPMFGEQLAISSRDPLTDEEVRARVTPHRAADWSPAEAAVVAGVLDRRLDSFDGCCPVVNFFTSPANAARWLGEHPHVHGAVISIDEAAAAGHAVFGKVLAEG